MCGQTRAGLHALLHFCYAHTQTFSRVHSKVRSLEMPHLGLRWSKAGGGDPISNWQPMCVFLEEPRFMVKMLRKLSSGTFLAVIVILCQCLNDDNLAIIFWQLADRRTLTLWFFYVLFSDQLQELRKVTLGGIICANMEQVRAVQPEVFLNLDSYLWVSFPK